MDGKFISKQFVAGSCYSCILSSNGEAAALAMLSPQDASEFTRKNPGVKFLDVRSVSEFNEAHIQNSINVPIDTLSSRTDELSRSGNGYIVYCRAGTRSPMAADMLVQSCIQGVKVMDGGITRWQKEKLPVVKGERIFSLERQVRLIAGGLVLLGIIMAWLAHPGFIIISLFVSCGLIFAGLTDSCLMGMLLMKLPYNKKMYKSKSCGGTCAIG